MKKATKINRYYLASLIRPEYAQENFVYVVSEEMIKNTKLPFFKLGGHPETQINPFVCVIGSCGFNKIRTNALVALEGCRTITASGSQYNLGNMHKDYKALCNAYSDGIPILVDFSIFDDDGKKRVKGYLISEEGVEPINQCIKMHQWYENKFVFEDDRKAFINWAALDEREKNWLIKNQERWSYINSFSKKDLEYDVDELVMKLDPEKNIVVDSNSFLGNIRFIKFYANGTHCPTEKEIDDAEGEKRETIFSYWCGE